MYQVVEQTYEEKVKMYSRLTKKELIAMLIEANKNLSERPLTIFTSTQFDRLKTYGDICSCNPLNGGSGICGCIMANREVKV